VVNRVGLLRTTLPTFLSFPHFHPFCYGGLGMVWDFNKFSMDDYLMLMEGSKLLAFTLALQLCLVLLKELIGRF
jgi:hypothetical protein